MLGFCFSLLVLTLLGWFLVSLLWPNVFEGPAARVLRLCFAFGFGSGFSSCAFLWWLCLTEGRQWSFVTFITAELAITLGLGVLYWFFSKLASRSIARFTTEWHADPISTKLFMVAFWTLLACTILSFVLISSQAPHGDYDAHAIWNLRARFLARGTNHWRDAFAESLSLTHVDYPLLLPATIARFWKYMGTEPVFVPIVIAFMFTLGSLGVVSSSLVLLRNRRVAYLAGIVLLGVPAFVIRGASQYADTVLGFFILSALVLLAFNDTTESKQPVSLLVLAGGAAGLCAWTKNEGLLFVAILLVVRVSFSVFHGSWATARRETVMLICGLVPVLLAVLYLKTSVAPNYFLLPGPIDAGPMKYFLDTSPVSEKLVSISRYEMIAQAMTGEILRFGGGRVGVAPLLLLYTTAAGSSLCARRSVEIGLVVLPLMLVGYFFIYLITPLNLAFQMDTSLSRLLVQLWPSLVFALFMSTSSGEKVRL